MEKDSESKISRSKYCCPAKQYYSHDANLGNTLKIVPRVIIYKKCLKLHNNYESIINITNKGLYKRHLVYATDNNDTTIEIVPKQLANNFLLPDESLQVSVRITPESNTNINRRRHVNITSKHPNITFSIPILIISNRVNDDNDISVATSIIFPPAAVKDFTYYEMIIYNKSNQKLLFNIKSPLADLKVHAKSFNILRKNYRKILLKLYCMNWGVVNKCLKLKFNTGNYFDVAFQHESLKWSLFVNTVNIDFESVRFKRQEIKEFSICNESNKDIVFHVNFISPEEALTDNYSMNAVNSCTKIKKNYKCMHRHFAFEPNCGTIPVNSTSCVKISFCPIMHRDLLPPNDNDDDGVLAMSVICAVSVSWQTEAQTEQRHIHLKGQIIGPEIEILPDVLNMQNLYFGEEHCAQISIINKDDKCDAHVSFCGLSNQHTAAIDATPKEGLTLKPNKRDVFMIQFYCKILGKFLIKLEFKVKYGNKYSMIIKGYSKQVQVKCYPDVLNLGIVPIAIPQKRLILLRNPLTVPITVQCMVTDDGNEIPLVLNTQNVNEHLPITVKDTCKHLKFNEEFEEEESSLLSLKSYNEDNLSGSSEFKELALDLIPELSHNLVSVLKSCKIFDISEIENKVVEETLNTLMVNTPYFSNMGKCKNYMQMNWNSLATYPKEIYCDKEIIYLKPSTDKTITVVIIPNTLGCHRKHIQLTVCPQIPSTGVAASSTETNDYNQIVSNEFMISKLFIEYKCAVPEIIWDNRVIMKEPLYAGEYYDFKMVFQNKNNFSGFFFYEVIPDSNLGVMKFANNKWKYFIEAGEKISVPCQVKFKKLGFVRLQGMLKLVGIAAGYPFDIESQVSSPKIEVSARFIYKNLKVLEFQKVYLFIENATTTTTWFKLQLKYESCMSIEPYGGQLCPNGQIICVTLSVMFHDPGIYRNELYIIMEFEAVEIIPICINVKGLPIFFEPEIRNKVLNLGCILCNGEEACREDKTKFFQSIKIINKGQRNYRFSITRIKSSAKTSCSINSTKAKLFIKPNNFILSAQSENSFNISISCCEAIQVINKFRIQLIDHADVAHMESYHFTLSATFIMPQLSWNRQVITMNYYTTHEHNEHEQWETIQLINITPLDVNNVNLKMSGPFQIKELYEHKYANELNFTMLQCETKEFFIMLQKNRIRKNASTIYEGTIKCTANLTVQKSVHLKVVVFVPQITLKRKQVMLFVKNFEGGSYIELTNMSDVPATYKWKKLKEDCNYISQEENVSQVASIVLSDLMHMLELETINPELDSEMNLTRRYQKYKCLLNYSKDVINVKEILHEIIDNLDLSIKRYKLCYQDSLPIGGNLKEEPKLENDLQSKFDEESSQIPDLEDLSHLNFQENLILSEPIPIAEMSSNVEDYVCYTLDDVLSHLKLEDSFEILSLASSENCELRKSIYFFKKSGILQGKEKEMCAFHIPQIRKGFEVRAIFQLDVIGGASQQLEIILINLAKTITLNKPHIYLGHKPWYERYQTKSCIQNATNYHLCLVIKNISNTIEEELPKIALGFNNVMENKTFQLPPLQNTMIQTEGIMGFNENFKRQISITINECEEKIIRISGHGTMPLLIMSKPELPLIYHEPYEVIEEYFLLQKIFYYEMFKTANEKEEEFKNIKQEEEENNIKEVESCLTNLTLTSNDVTESFLDMEKELKYLKLMQTYVVINNNENLPNSTILEQLLQTEKFLNLLRFNSKTVSLLNTLYQNYLLQHKSCNEKFTIFNLKQFTVQSLPFHSRIHILDMGKVYINQYTKFTITWKFIGPGKLTAAARTAIEIPGLTIDFRVLETDANCDFIYYSALKDNVTRTSGKKFYRNMNERLFDKEMSAQVKHAHSFDFNPLYQHQRIVKFVNTKCLRNYYNSLNKSIYLEQKHHFIHSKMAANRKKTQSIIKISIIVLFRPQKSYYKHNQELEDYLYIDLHMGPTFPVLLKAIIIDRNRKDN